jgi:hypothetical protein
MGKKSKRKRMKYRYTKTEFTDIICTQCGLCPKDTDPVFCFGDVYKESPKKFIRVIFKNLMEVKRWLVNVGQSHPSFLPDEDIEYIFKMGFCSSNYCGQRGAKNTCEYLAGCISAFRKQIKNPNGQLIHLSDFRNNFNNAKSSKKQKKKNRKKAAKARYVPQPYPTFFCNERMESEVKRIVDGNRAKQQDQSEKST